MNSGESSNDNEIIKLQEENKHLRELVENYKNDVSNATKFAQQVMLEYGSRAKEEKPEDKTALDIANQHLSDYFNKFNNKNKGD